MIEKFTRATQNASFSVKGVSKNFEKKGDKFKALAAATLSVESGKFIALVGPSGCGKSTLLNILAGLKRPDQGDILLNGKKVSHIRGHAAYMQQKDLLLPWRTVLDNVILGMEIQGEKKSEARRKASNQLGMFGLKGFENHYPAEISGGMRQRAALMRTLLCGKPVLLLDEPFGALDAITRQTMRQYLIDLWLCFRTSVLLVTHDVEEAILLADKIYVMSPRPGRVKSQLICKLKRPRTPDLPSVISAKKQLMEILLEKKRKAA